MINSRVPNVKDGDHLSEGARVLFPVTNGGCQNCCIIIIIIIMVIIIKFTRLIKEEEVYIMYRDLLKTIGFIFACIHNCCTIFYMCI